LYVSLLENYHSQLKKREFTTLNPQIIQDSLFCEALNRSIYKLNQEIRMEGESGTTLCSLFLFPIYETLSLAISSNQEPIAYRVILANIGDCRCVFVSTISDIDLEGFSQDNHHHIKQDSDKYLSRSYHDGNSDSDHSFSDKHEFRKLSSTQVGQTTITPADVMNNTSTLSLVSNDPLSQSEHSYFGGFFMRQPSSNKLNSPLRNKGSTTISSTSCEIITATTPNNSSHSADRKEKELIIEKEEKYQQVMVVDKLREPIVAHTEPKPTTQDLTFPSSSSSISSTSSQKKMKAMRPPNQNMTSSTRVPSTKRQTFVMNLTEDHNLFLERERYRIEEGICLKTQSLPFELSIQNSYLRYLEESIVLQSWETTLPSPQIVSSPADPQQQVSLSVTIPQTYKLSNMESNSPRHEKQVSAKKKDELDVVFRKGNSVVLQRPKVIQYSTLDDLTAIQLVFDRSSRLISSEPAQEVSLDRFQSYLSFLPSVTSLAYSIFQSLCQVDNKWLNNDDLNEDDDHLQVGMSHQSSSSSSSSTLPALTSSQRSNIVVTQRSTSYFGNRFSADGLIRGPVAYFSRYNRSILMTRSIGDRYGPRGCIAQAEISAMTIPAKSHHFR
jgi:hypothetical protein